MAQQVARPVRGQTTAEPTQTFSLADIRVEGRKLPARLVLHGVEGVGKTSFGAQMPKPVFLQSKGETGLETLMEAGLIQKTPHFPEIQSWQTALGALRALLSEDHDYKSLVIDALNGFERLCFEFVCASEFNNDWGEKGFTGYQRGPEVSLSHWREFLSLLDQLRERKGMRILLLCHTKIQNFKNPEGADFDRYEPDLNRKTWSLTHKWSDAVLFVNFYQIVDDGSSNKTKGKVRGGQQRVMYTQRHGAYDAKNRFGLPEEIDFGNTPAEAWANFVQAMKNGGGK